MREKNFEFKGQMINYYNKVIANKNVVHAWCGFNCQKGCYEVCWCYREK